MMWKPLKKERTNPYIRNPCVAVILEKLEIYFYFNGILPFSNKLKGELYCVLKYQNKKNTSYFLLNTKYISSSIRNAEH